MDDAQAREGRRQAGRFTFKKVIATSLRQLPVAFLGIEPFSGNNMHQDQAGTHRIRPGSSPVRNMSTGPGTVQRNQDLILHERSSLRLPTVMVSTIGGTGRRRKGRKALPLCGTVR
ncbi:hypothetical protein StoSoilB3_19920 [Arthrobacter sp. StoSoilB3]|nr:hypothetical protein StoSoilB3_19920 [Arthrobacter sp. StoSoilB3]